MLDFWKKYWKPAFDIGLIILTVYLFMALFSFLFSIATPIFISFVIYLIIKPFASFLERRGIKKTIAVTISTFCFVAFLLGFFIFLGAVVTSQIEHLSNTIPKYADGFQRHFDNTVNYLQNQYESLPNETAKNIKENFSNISEKAAKFASGFLIGLFTFLTKIPTLIANFVIGLILAFFLALEIESWNELAKKKTPKTFKLVFVFLKDNVIKGISKYIKSQLILISFTFALVFIGLLIFGVDNAFTLSLLAGLFDILPLLGVSSLFLPWIIYLFVVANTTLAIKLSILLVVVIGFRQIMEPKITGDSLGVSAFTMLAVMIISLSIFGVAGMILSPVILILLKALIDQGYLKKWIRIPEEEFDYND